MKKLKSVEEHNSEIHSSYRSVNKWSTGVACPQCGTELHFVNNNLLLSYPAQRSVKCLECPYVGNILAHTTFV